MSENGNALRSYIISSIKFAFQGVGISLAIVGIYVLAFFVLAPRCDRILPVLLLLILLLAGIVLVLLLISMLLATFQQESPGATPGLKNFFVFLQFMCIVLCVVGCIHVTKNMWSRIGKTYEAGDYSEHTCAVCQVKSADGGRLVVRSTALGEPDEVYYYCKRDFDRIQNKHTGNSSGPGFTNDYGTPNTSCAKSGCMNKIASSGNTAYCTSHSGRCLNCHCYIDPDAMYCMDCLEDYFNK